MNRPPPERSANPGSSAADPVADGVPRAVVGDHGAGLDDAPVGVDTQGVAATASPRPPRCSVEQLEEWLAPAWLGLYP